MIVDGLPYIDVPERFGPISTFGILLAVGLLQAPEVVGDQRQVRVTLLTQDPLEQEVFGFQDAVALEFPDGSRRAEILTLTTARGAVRAFTVLVPLQEQIELTGDDLTAGMPRIAFVVTDAAGNELSREPLFPHLQEGA